ncbi:hypothetical protein E143388_08290 [Rhodococcus opacus]|nr:hypothetical protein E143388_08290 [Rhodococcus opacus]
MSAQTSSRTCCASRGFCLQGKAKTLAGNQNPDRDAQFGYINEQVRTHQQAGELVMSVGTKKKERADSASDYFELERINEGAMTSSERYWGIELVRFDNYFCSNL